MFNLNLNKKSLCCACEQNVWWVFADSSSRQTVCDGVLCHSGRKLLFALSDPPVTSHRFLVPSLHRQIKSAFAFGQRPLVVWVRTGDASFGQKEPRPQLPNPFSDSLEEMFGDWRRARMGGGILARASTQPLMTLMERCSLSPLPSGPGGSSHLSAALYKLVESLFCFART